MSDEVAISCSRTELFIRWKQEENPTEKKGCKILAEIVETKSFYLRKTTHK